MHGPAGAAPNDQPFYVVAAGSPPVEATSGRSTVARPRVVHITRPQWSPSPR
jgi:hypothetical protein